MRHYDWLEYHLIARFNTLKRPREIILLLRSWEENPTKSQMGDRNNFGNFDFFSKKKCIIHLVELDELFPKIWVSDLKTACGRCGAHAKVEKRVKRIIGLQVTWLNLNHKTDKIWISHTSKKNDLRQIFDWLSRLRKNHELKFQFAKCFFADNSW